MFSKREFRMAPLTVLTGMNGSGKTSIIHSLLLMREAMASESRSVQLNGPYNLELGTFGDIQNWDSPDTTYFSATDQDDKESIWKFGGIENSLYADIVERPLSPPQAFTEPGRAFQYISAERYGPRSILGSTALPPDLLKVGVKGEFSAQVLYTLDNFLVNNALRHPNEEPQDAALLKFETERWLSSITRPVQIDTESLATSTAMALRFRAPDGEWVRPPNMGFGVTYALPVVLAGLTASAGGLFIVENPEAHLHPAGQSQMGVFLGTIAASGIQVLIETHSDHILNGIRRAIGEHKVLSPEKAIVHFFDVGNIEPKELEFTALGGISYWPKGFFDQYQTDVSALTKIRRGGAR